MFSVSQSAFCWRLCAAAGITRDRSRADVVHDRLIQWNENKSLLWDAVLLRNTRERQRTPGALPNDSTLEKRVVKAIRAGDVRKALQMFNAAPIAPKTEETFQALQDLHPRAQRRVPSPSIEPSGAPHFSDKLVREALGTFSPSSAAGLFGYRPWILQQCVRAESFHFLPTLARAVNMFAAGEGPSFLHPFVAGGFDCFVETKQRCATPVLWCLYSPFSCKEFLSRWERSNFQGI